MIKISYGGERGLVQHFMVGFIRYPALFREESNKYSPYTMPTRQLSVQ